MKTFDPMNSGDDDSDFEAQLLGMELRRPPAEWKAALLAGAVPAAAAATTATSAAAMPKALLIFLSLCWAATAFFVITRPEDEKLDLPMPPSSVRPGSFQGDPVFTFNEATSP
jgi:hypothetical protein